MNTDIKNLTAQLAGELPENAYKISDQLARIGNEEVISAMLDLLQHPNPESRIMAARTLGKIDKNQPALDALLAAIKDPGNKQIAGELIMALEGFDVSGIYVELFRLYLFGSFKVSLIAKELLDFEEFDITPRVIRKAEKHWNHYANNARHDETFEIKKGEVSSMLDDLKAFLGQG